MEDDPRTIPEKVEADTDVGLRVTWADGHVSRWDLLTIRRACRCAACGEIRRAGGRVAPPPFSGELDVVDAELVGDYGVTFTWSDGHATGIYTWDRLREGCPCGACRRERRDAGTPDPLAP